MTGIKYKIYNVIALLVLTYLLNNCSIPFSGTETGTLKLYEYTKHYLSDKLESISDGEMSLYQKDLSWNDSIALINTSFDLTLVDYYGDRDFPQGKVAITDRKDLYDFLKIAYQENTYKYIIVDIALDKRGTNYDDSLALLIPQMNNITVARGGKFSLMNSLHTKSGWVDYFKMPYETGFVKYKIGTNEKQSLALRVYNERNNRNAINSILGLLYFDGWRFCQENIVLKYDIRFILEEGYSSDSVKTAGLYSYQNLGTDFIDRKSQNILNKINKTEKVKDCIRDKIVVIGDFLGDDIHETYVGKMPGALINLNAYLELQRGGHLIHIHHVILLFLFYLSLYFIKDNRDRIIRFRSIANYVSSDFLQILISIIGWGTFFNLVALLVYVLFDTFFNPWLPALWFTFVPQCVKLFKSVKFNK